ncbi:CBS domain-containing protein [Bradyrhizobium sp.]|uniref:CBS domain-containing protein n=1 Tax=Bradyrhizobium sp. TaxID=376 RepID=UPI0025B9F6BD|nr:CBS domain-containing protein [Bradyrhizobium sp.]
MLVRDVMVAPVITVKPSTTVKEVAELFLEKRISAAPVVESDQRLVGVVSEGDLLHRVEAGTERHHSWWLRGLIGDDTLAAEYVKSHGLKVSDVMTRKVVTATPETPLHEVAALLEKNAIKRVPILENGQLVGIVSRANLIQAVATAHKLLDIPLSDTTVRENVLSHLKRQPWAHTALLNVTVNGGVVDLWGVAESAAQRKAIKVAAESTLGVSAVNDNLVIRPVATWE